MQAGAGLLGAHNIPRMLGAVVGVSAKVNGANTYTR
jgi:hypothetical protein